MIPRRYAGAVLLPIADANVRDVCLILVATGSQLKDLSSVCGVLTKGVTLSDSVLH